MKEFQEFCRVKGFNDEDAVSEQKILLFLVERVEGRERRGKSKKIISAQTVSQYVSALVDLYCQQSQMGTNTNPHPRGPSLKG